MEKLEAILLPIVQTINTYLSDYILIFLLVGTGLYFTIRTKFVQVRCFGEGMKKVFGGLSLSGGKNKSGLSSFQALATAVAAQVGTGNIVGASGAILIGGPGAIFWMWVIAFFGMATIYAEATLAQETRVTSENGEILGGPVYYIKKAYKGVFGKVLAAFFAIALIIALGFIGTMVQSNSISGAIETAFGIPTWIIGAILAVVCAIIFIGGIQRIASVAEKIVPVMAVIYIIVGLTVLVINFKHIPETFGMIFKYAFTPTAILGGTFGAAIKAAVSQGAKRGLFSNEAGMGSTPHAHAQANVKTPHEQGTVAFIGLFIDTFIVLNITALVVISTLYTGDGLLAKHVDNGTEYTAYVREYDSEGNVSATNEITTNSYLIATGQTKNTVVAELILDDSIVLVDNTANFDEKYTDVSTLTPINPTVAEMIEKYPAYFMASEKTANSIAAATEDEEKNVINIDEAITVLKDNGCLTDVAVAAKGSLMQTSVGNALAKIMNPEVATSIGNIVVAVCLTFFAFTTVIGWNFFGKQNVEYLFGKKATIVYSVIAIVFIFAGSLFQNDLVWELADMFNNIMVIPNVLALIPLGYIVAKCAKSAKKNSKK